MLKPILSLSLAALFTAAVHAQEPAQAPETKGPSIFVEQPEFNFGIVDTDITVEHTFVIRNIGDETLEISNARPACGCTVANMTRKSVPPGETTELTAKLSLRGRKGHQSKAITISSNDPQKPNYRLTMVGEVHQAIQVNPDRLIFGQMSPNQEITLNIELNSTSEQAFQILKIETNFGSLLATAKDSVSSTNQTVIATLTAPEAVGPVNGVVRITTDHPARTTIDVPVAANVVGELVYAPSVIDVPQASGDAALTRSVVVRRGSGSEFEISEIITPTPDMTAQIYPFGDQGYRIVLGNVKVSDDLNEKSLRILTTAESMSEISIPFKVR